MGTMIGTAEVNHLLAVNPLLCPDSATYGDFHEEASSSQKRRFVCLVKSGGFRKTHPVKLSDRRVQPAWMRETWQVTCGNLASSTDESRRSS